MPLIVNRPAPSVTTDAKNAPDVASTEMPAPVSPVSVGSALPALTLPSIVAPAVAPARWVGVEAYDIEEEKEGDNDDDLGDVHPPPGPSATISAGQDSAPPPVTRSASRKGTWVKEDFRNRRSQSRRVWRRPIPPRSPSW